MSKVSIYSDIRNIDRGHNIDIDLALERIKLGRSKDIVEQIRYNLKEGNLEEAKKLKTFKLPYVCFSGTFTRRDDDSIVDHSGFAILDFDHLPEDIMVECKNFLKGHTFVHSYWRSPSGDGLKVLIRIPNSIQDHKDYYLGIVKHFSEYKEYLDETSINLSRACFESYDPQIYINEDSEEFVEKYVSVAITYTAPESIRTDYAKVNVAANIIRHSLPGEMHANGKTRPLSELLAAANEEEILEGILTLDKVKDQMAANFKFGSKKGMTTGIPHVDRVFKWMKGFTYVFAGYANHGKTEFLNYLMLMKSLKDGFKWAVFSPEGHTPDTFYDNLIHMYAGQTTDHRSDNQLSMTRYWEAAEFIKKHFFFIYPKKEHSAENINAIFKYLVDKENVDGCVIDPYNQLSFDSTGSEYLQIRNFLQLQRRFYIENNVIGIIVAHPKNPSPNDNGSIDPPQVYQISGGAEWNNKSDVIMTYHRPNFYVDISDTACIFGTKKVKRQKDMALPGDIDMRFDRKTNRFVFLDPSVSQSFIDYMQEHFDSQKVQPNNNLENLF